MVVTEAELREAWRNGRGSLPDFPPGARFTPAAKDFLASLGAAPPAAPAPQLPASLGANPSGRLELRAEGKGRLVLTAVDVDDLIAARPEAIVVHPAVTLTDIARERLRSAGVRILPYVEADAAAAGPAAAIAPVAPSPTTAPAPVPGPSPDAQAEKEALFQAAKKAVMARLGGRADEALVDAVLRRVISSL